MFCSMDKESKGNNQVMVSVFMIAYKHRPYIEQAIESVLKQKVNFKYEIVVGEDASNDGSKEILLEYEKKYPGIFKLIIHENNVGAARNAYYVAKACSGKYVANLECDDFWCDENKLQKQVDYLEAHADIVATGTNYKCVDNDGKNPITIMAPFETNKTYNMKDYLKFGMEIHTNTLMYRNIIPTEGEKYEEVRFCIPSMGDVFKRSLLYDLGDIYVFPEVMLCHRDGKQVSSSFQAQQKNNAMKSTRMIMILAEKMNQYFDGKYDFTQKVVTRMGKVYYAYILGGLNIDMAEYREIKKTLSFKNRLLIKRHVCHIFLLKVRRKLYRRRNG